MPDQPRPHAFVLDTAAGGMVVRHGTVAWLGLAAAVLAALVALVVLGGRRATVAVPVDRQSPESVET